jgi:hypothetical protein
MRSGVLNSLNRDIIALFSLSLTQIFQKLGPPTQVYQCKAALMSLATASKGAETLCIYIMWKWDAIWGA